jgi:L-alanine-DL-glutamate epimerase-like enolase superfamily enzyme
MRISNLKTTALEIPLEKALLNVTKTRATLQIILLQVETDAGLVGHGYTYTDGYGGPAIKVLLETDVLDLVRGRDPRDVKALSGYVLWEIRHAGIGGITSLAVAALDLALWDVFTQTVELPLSKLLGAYTDRIPMYASIAGWSGLPIEQQVARAEELVAKGISGIKVQIARAPLETDVLRLQTLRKALGPTPRLFVDANTVMSVPQAITLGRAIQGYDIFWMEEPIAVRDLEGYREISRHVAIPLATGEHLFCPRDCDEYIRRRLVSYMQADVLRVGGICEWLRIAGLADGCNVKMSPHFVMEVHTQLLCTIPNAQFVEYIPWLQAYFKEPTMVENGYAVSRQKPGLGLEFDQAAIEKFRVS